MHARFFLFSAVGLAVSAASPALAQQVQHEDGISIQGPGSAWNLRSNDRVFLITQQADTMDPMSFRVGTVDQLQTIDTLGTGYSTDVFADFAPTHWLQVGATINYGNIGDPAVQNILAPTAYAKFQFLRQQTAGVNMAAAVNVKKIGFSRPTDAHPNDGEIEAQVMADKRIGRLSLTANAVFGKSFSVPDSDAELKLAAGYHLLRNLVVGVDSITRYDSSFDGGPHDGTRYWEFTGGGMVGWKVSNFTVSGLVGVSAPMHTPVTSPGIGPTAMVQLAYGL